MGRGVSLGPTSGEGAGPVLSPFDAAWSQAPSPHGAGDLSSFTALAETGFVFQRHLRSHWHYSPPPAPLWRDLP